MGGASATESERTPLGSLLVEELAPRPGRLAGAVRVAVCCVVVTVAAMVLQIPDAAIAVYLVFPMMREDVVASALAGLAAAVTVSLATVLALALIAFDAGSESLRIPLMAVATGVTMYASRAFKIGPAARVAGYALVYGQTFLDAFPTAEEAVRAVLWLWVVVALPIGVVVLLEVMTGERPAAKARRSALGLLRALSESLRSPGAPRPTSRHAEAVELFASARRAAMVDARVKGRLGSDLHLMETLGALLLMADLLPAGTPPAVRAPLADECDACANAFERGEAPAPRSGPILGDSALAGVPPDALPTVRAMAGALERLRDGLDRIARGVVAPMGHEERPRITDAAERRQNVLFGVKAALAVTSAYLIYTGFGYTGISTAVATCFFVSLDSLGESVQKLTLRIAGALIGGFAAGLSIAFIRPSMEDIGQLSLLVGAAALICAWVASSTVRLSYMGLQMALAFFLGMLQGQAPPDHFRVLWNRVIGILLGNLIVTVVFSTLWPESVKARANRSIAQALDCLAALVGAREPRVGARLAVLQSLDQARRLEQFEKFELHMMPATAPKPEPQEGMSVSELRRLAGRTFVAAELPGSPAIADQVRTEIEASARSSSRLEEAHGVTS